MDIAKTRLKLELEIPHLYSFHYFEFSKNFLFEGEQHNFWELVYVDVGELEVTADRTGYVLKQGDIIFHEPNEFHSLWANKRIAPNVVIITFECNSPAMQFFRNKMFNLGDYERNLLASVVKYGLLTFEPPLDDPHHHHLTRRSDAPFGSEQLIRMHLETLLLSMISQQYSDSGKTRLSTTARERSDRDLLQRLLAYMQENIGRNLTLEQICGHMHISKTLLVRLFKQQTGQNVMTYYRHMKIERAKTLIREQRHNVTEIAELLGYPSIHSFSRHFKQATEMTPSGYSRSIQARL